MGLTWPDSSGNADVYTTPVSPAPRSVRVLV